MVVKRTKAEYCFDALNVLFMCLIILVCVYPICYVLFASFSRPSLLIAHQGLLFRPLGFDLSSYRMVMNNPMISKGYRNTLFVVLAGTSINLTLTAFGAYVLSRKGYYWKNFILFFILITMFFSGGLIPFYLTVTSMGFLNSLWALILPTAINTYNMIIMRTGFAGLPDALEESARIDGANDFTILWKIFVPLSKPVIAVMILYYGVAHWNAWFNAMIFIRNRELYPLQLILREILISSSTDNMTAGAGAMDQELIGEGVKYATIVVATVPILMIYPFLQKYFVKGIMIGAVKG